MSTLTAQINAGPDVTLCQGQSATLNAVASGGYGTDSYTFEVYPYQPETYTGGTPVTFGGNQDDQVAGPFNIGFQFCFFNSYYTQFYIGSNGWVGFSYSSSWTTYTSQAIPSTSSSVPKNCIMAPWQDWHPGVSSSYGPPYVFFKTIGTAPNRKLVVYWNQCPMYSCTTTYGTFQIVLNEQSSIVENHLTNKPNCTSWAGGTATQGVHNSTGSTAFTATGRNSTQWVVTNESTRFVPSGIKWYTGGYPGGNIVGYGPEITVTPAVTTVYTAVVNVCGGQVFTDNVTVTVVPADNATFSYGSSTLCQSGNSGPPTTTFPGGSYSAVPPGLIINPSTGNINLGASTPGAYTVTHITTGQCPDTATISLTLVTSPSASFGYPQSAYCVSAMNPLPVFPPGSSAGTFTSAPAGLVFVSIFTGEVNLAASNPGVYNVINTIPPSAACPQVSFSTILEVLTLPPPATMPQGSADLCENPPNTQYSTTPQPNTISYSWILQPPAAGTIMGNGPNALVNWSDNFIGPAAIAVSATNACGDGQVSPHLVVHINPLPKETGTPSGPASHCQGPGLSLYETSGSAYATYYEWMLMPVTAGSVVGNGQSVSVSWSAGFSGTAQLSVRGVNECGNSVWSVPLDILVFPMPLTASRPAGPVSFCSGGGSDSYTTGLMANTTSYLWVLTPANAGTINGSSNSVSINWDPLFSGPVQLKVAGQNECGTGPFSPPLEITIAPLPLISAGNDTTVLIDAVIVLKGSVFVNPQGMQYHWEPAAMLEDPDIMRPVTLPLSNTTSFILTVTDAEYGCQSEDDVLVEVEGAPLIALVTGSPLSICAGETSMLSVQAFGGSSSNYQYSWYLNGVFFSNLQNLVVNPAITTSYECEVWDGSAIYSTGITIEVWPVPVADAGNDLQIPFNTQAQLSGSAFPAGNYTYQWEPADLLNNSTLQYPVTLLLTESTLFSLVVTDQHGCVSLSDEMFILVEGGWLSADPMAVPDTLCFGERSMLYALPSGGIPAGYSYRWLEGTTFFSDQPMVEVTPTSSTVYSLELNDGFSSVDRNVSVTVNPVPVVSLIGPNVHHEGNTILACVYDTVTIALNNPDSRFLWSDGSTGNKIDLWTSGLSFDFREIWVEVTDNLTGCMTRAEVYVLLNFTNCSYGVNEPGYRNTLLVYPNPAGDKVIIKSSGTFTENCLIRLYGIRGDLLTEKTVTLSGEGSELNLSDVCDGVYLLRVISGNELSVIKLMVSKSLD
ncbi:MAG: T9SS type A sorting domain-containing protein [Bacteroidota bacterium]